MISTDQVSRICKELDGQDHLPHSPADAEMLYLMLDDTFEKVGENGRATSMAVLMPSPRWAGGVPVAAIIIIPCKGDDGIRQDRGDSAGHGPGRIPQLPPLNPVVEPHKHRADVAAQIGGAPKSARST